MIVVDFFEITVTGQLIVEEKRDENDHDKADSQSEDVDTLHTRYIRQVSGFYSEM